MHESFHIERHYALRDRLPMWVVYRPTTADLNGSWVIRMHLFLPNPEATDLLILVPTIEAVREQLPMDLTNIGRNTADDPVIHEVWL